MRRHVYNPDQVDLFPPASDWEPPESLPHVPSGATVAIDSETCDRGLAAGRGPGWVTRDGWLCGVSWAWRTSATEVEAGYAPTRHPETRCFPEEQVVEWVLDLHRRCHVVFQNAGYDLGWIGIEPEREYGDTHTMAVLLDENRPAYGLDDIAAWLGVPGKDETLLREAVIAYGGNPRKIKEHIWRLPGRYVGPYAEQDAVATLLCAERMAPMMETQGLTEAYQDEVGLAPYVIEMRRTGIRIDVDAAEANQSRIRQMRAQKLDELRDRIGTWQRREVTMDDVRSPRWLETCFREHGIGFPRTPTGQPSFEKEFLERLDDPIGKLIADARKLNDAAEKFIGTYILEHLERGRIHAEIHQLRDTDAGTRSYRFSYSNPPLQQMNRAEPDKATPGHKDFVPGFVDVGTMIREAFLPEQGEVWGAPDYSQQEYRLIVHYAILMGLRKADVAAQKYRDDPNTDFHNFVVELTGLIRKRAKDCNFAKAFGAGKDKFAAMTGMSVDEAVATMLTYDTEMPFVRDLGERCDKTAQQRGYVRLLDGRRSRFDQWEVSWVPREGWERGRREGHLMTPCDREEALRRQSTPGHPWQGKRLKRSGTHKACNRIIQGGAAVQTKKAMLAQCREGYVPLLQMHDELCHSVGDPTKARRIAEIMRDVVPLQVPVKVDNEFGTDWGRAKYSFEEAMRKLRERRP